MRKKISDLHGRIRQYVECNILGIHRWQYKFGSTHAICVKCGRARVRGPRGL